MSNRSWIALAVLAIIMLVGLVAKPPNNLTPEQKLAIAADCSENPDSFRCR